LNTVIPEIRIGQPLRYESLSVFPLSSSTESTLKYLLENEAFRSDAIIVKEIDKDGVVSQLKVESRCNFPVLLLEGSELDGAKQNRVLNCDVLVPPHQTIHLPVSCVEEGRWGYKSPKFTASGRHSSSRLRHTLKASVTESLKAKRGHSSDQRGIWEEVARQQKSLGVFSTTKAMADTFKSYLARTKDFHEKLAYPEGTSGFAVALADKVMSLDLFDKAIACKEMWDRLLSGNIMDALEAGPRKRGAEVTDIERLLALLDNATWEQYTPIGDGEEYRAECGQSVFASLLSLNGTIIHASAVAAV